MIYVYGKFVRAVNFDASCILDSIFLRRGGREERQDSRWWSVCSERNAHIRFPSYSRWTRSYFADGLSLNAFWVEWFLLPGCFSDGQLSSCAEKPLTTERSGHSSSRILFMLFLASGTQKEEIRCISFLTIRRCLVSSFREEFSLSYQVMILQFLRGRWSALSDVNRGKRRVIPRHSCANQSKIYSTG